MTKFNYIFGEKYNLRNFKAHKKAELHPDFNKYLFRKSIGGLFDTSPLPYLFWVKINSDEFCEGMVGLGNVIFKTS